MIYSSLSLQPTSLFAASTLNHHHAKNQPQASIISHYLSTLQTDCEAEQYEMLDVWLQGTYISRPSIARCVNDFLAPLPDAANSDTFTSAILGLLSSSESSESPSSIEFKFHCQQTYQQHRTVAGVQLLNQHHPMEHFNFAITKPMSFYHEVP
jgi:hypothetical protein